MSKRAIGVTAAVGIIVVLAAIGTSGTAQPAAEPAPQPSETIATPAVASSSEPAATTLASAPAPSPVTVNGSGTGNSAPFELGAGDYRATWQARGSCFVWLELQAATGAYLPGGTIALQMVNGSASGETYLYGLPAGRYYVAANAGCPWSVTIAGQ